MSLESRELGEILSHIQREFADDPAIKIISGEGDAPSQYEVQYDIPSATSDDEGNVSITSPHIVSISIPFGFPHFPPSCKPKSAIFHPDFDTAAICLGDFWDRDKSIPDLIRHIGTLLSGEIFSRDNAFNMSAALWFTEHENQLPFTSLGDTSPESGGENSLELSLDDSEDFELATLEDVDLVDEYEFDDDSSLSMQDESQPLTPPAEIAAAEATTSVDVPGLLLLAEQKNFHQLRDELDTLFSQSEFDEQAHLSELASSTLLEANQTYSQAKEYEDDGFSQKALEKFRAVESLVADYPNIRSDIQRTEQAAGMLDEINTIGHGMESGAAAAADSTNQEPSSPPAQAAERTATDSRPADKPVFFEESSKRPINIMPLIVTGMLLCLTATLTYFYFSLSSKLTEAKQLYSECAAKFTDKEFETADQACKASLESVQGIYLIHQREVTEVVSNTRKILDSEELRQGLLGKILHDGKYIARDSLEAFHSFEQIVRDGDTYSSEKLWDKAILSYSSALDIAPTMENISADKISSLEQKLNLTHLRALLAEADQLMNSADWAKAITVLTDAAARLDPLPAEEQQQYRPRVKNLLAKTRFEDLRGQAEALFSQSDWDKAIELFQKAAAAGQSLSASESGDMMAVHKNIARAELYSIIKAGNTAFAAGEWNAAIDSYRKAKAMLNTNAEQLNLREPEKSRQKIQRIMLQSAILRDHQLADKGRESGNLREARDHMQQVIDNIVASDFRSDPEFIEILVETRRTLSTIEEELFISEKTQYLLDNYIELFVENYSAANPDTLSLPEVTYQKRIGKLYLFKLQCTETGRGRPLKLIMYYSYNPDNGSWRFYSDS